MATEVIAIKNERKFNEANGIIYYGIGAAVTASAGRPMKALAWEDDQGQIWLAYNDPANIARRHGINNRARIVDRMTAALNTMTDKVIV